MRNYLAIIGALLAFSVITKADAQSSPLTLKKPISPSFQIKSFVPPKNQLAPDLLQKLQNKGDVFKYRRMGGATSGGGDDVGLEVQKSLGFVISAIENNYENLYGKKVKNAFVEMSEKVKVILVDEELPVKSNESFQNGAAYSSFDGNEAYILIQRQRWKSIDKPSVKDTLIHHELAVLIGLEATGYYRYSNKFAVLREKFWEKMKSKKIACTVSLFDEMSAAYSDDEEPSIGKLLGSAGIVLNSTTAISDFAVIADLNPQIDGKSNRAVIVRYVAANDGYLRAVISEADVTRYKTNDWKFFGNLSSDSLERIYYSPYDLAEPAMEARFERWNKYFVQVACSKL